jgi:hypothetical protein
MMPFSLSYIDNITYALSRPSNSIGDSIQGIGSVFPYFLCTNRMMNCTNKIQAIVSGMTYVAL